MSVQALVRHVKHQVVSREVLTETKIPKVGTKKNWPFWERTHQWFKDFYTHTHTHTHTHTQCRKTDLLGREYTNSLRSFAHTKKCRQTDIGREHSNGLRTFAHTKKCRRTDLGTEHTYGSRTFAHTKKCRQTDLLGREQSNGCGTFANTMSKNWPSWKRTLQWFKNFCTHNVEEVTLLGENTPMVQEILHTQRNVKQLTFLGENTPMVPPSSLRATPISARTASRSFLIASVFRSFDSHDSFSSAISFSLSFSRSMASSPPSIVTEDFRDLDFVWRSCISWRFTEDKACQTSVNSTQKKCFIVAGFFFKTWDDFDLERSMLCHTPPPHWENLLSELPVCLFSLFFFFFCVSVNTFFFHFNLKKFL